MKIKNAVCWVATTAIIMACLLASITTISRSGKAIAMWWSGYDAVEVSYAENTHLVVNHHEGASQEVVRFMNNCKASVYNQVDTLLYGDNEIVAKAKGGHLLMGYTHQKGLLDYLPNHRSKETMISDSQTMFHLATKWGQENNVPTYWCGRVN